MQNSDANNNLVLNSNDNVSKQVSQGNNRENPKENRRVEEIASAIRDSYRANEKELKGLLNQNGGINYDELNRITKSILSGAKRIRSPFFSDTTARNPSSRRIIEATLIGQAVRQSDSGDVRGTRTEESEQTKKQELAFVKCPKENNIWHNDILSFGKLIPV